MASNVPFGFSPRSLTTLLLLVAFTACSPAAPTSPESTVNVARPEASVKTAPKELVWSTVSLTMPQGTCSGVLVSPTRVLTAAHCLDTLAAAELAVVRLGVDMRTPGVAFTGVGAVRVHPLLDLGTLDLSGPVPSPYTPAEILPVDARIAAGEGLVFGGYGRTRHDLTDEGQFLRWGRLSFESFVASFTYSSGETFRSVLTFVPGAKGSTACGGDSGGPIFKSHGGRYGLVGVISGSSDPCEDKDAGTFTADARPNTAWIFDTSSSTDEAVSSNACVVTAQSPNVNGLNVRTFDDTSTLQAAVMQGTTLALFGATKAPQRHQVRVTGYVHQKETNCQGDVDACAAGLASTGKSFQLADAFGAALRAAPSSDASIDAVVVPGTRLRLLNKIGEWYQVDFTGTVPTRFCPRG